MTFTLLPAVDVADGRTVRLTRGEVDTDTTHGAPLDVAREFQAGGAEWIHLVDLDAAFGRGSNAELLAAMVGKLDAKVELSGGIHDDHSLAQALATGCDRVNLATTALDDLAWCSRAIDAHGERIAVGLDVHLVAGAGGPVHHRLAARGGHHDSGDLWETLAQLDRAGCERYVVTDVSRDGMLGGPNVELYHDVTRSTPAPVIVSGGISSIEDLVTLAQAAAEGANLEGAIVGKALYAGRFTLPDALHAVRGL